MYQFLRFLLTLGISALGVAIMFAIRENATILANVIVMIGTLFILALAAELTYPRNRGSKHIGGGTGTGGRLQQLFLTIRQKALDTLRTIVHSRSHQDFAYAVIVEMSLACSSAFVFFVYGLSDIITLWEAIVAGITTIVMFVLVLPTLSLFEATRGRKTTAC